MAARGDKTEQPTQRRLDKARKEGRFPASREFAGAIQFLGFVMLLSAMGGELMSAGRELMRSLLRSAFRPSMSGAELGGMFQGVVEGSTKLLVAGLGLTLLSLSAHLAVTRMGLAGARLAPDFKRLNPAPRLTSMGSQNLHSAMQALILLPLFGAALWYALREHMALFFRLPLSGLEQAVRSVGSVLDGLLWRGALVFLVLGAMDLMRQKRRHASELKMSKQEVREEMKEAEGDPHIKARIRRIQRDLLRRRMMSQVPTATAVVVNPTHFAVALRYDMEASGAPMVVAKGKNYLALRIKQKAIDHGVPIVENPPLAQSLYKAVNVGQEIPPHLYRAVAEVLAYIYRVMNGRLPGGNR